MPRKRTNSGDTLVSVSIFAEVEGVPPTPDVQLVEHHEACAAVEAAAAIDARGAGAQPPPQPNGQSESDRAAGGGGGRRRASNENAWGGRAPYPDDRRYDPAIHTGGVAEYDIAAAADSQIAGRSRSLDLSAKGLAGAAPWRSSSPGAFAVKVSPDAEDASAAASQKSKLHSSVTDGDGVSIEDLQQHKRKSSLLSRYDMDLTGQFEDSWSKIYNTAQVRDKSMGKYPDTPDFPDGGDGQRKGKRRNLMWPVIVCLCSVGAVIGTAVALGRNGGDGNGGGGGGVGAAAAGMLDAIGLGGEAANAGAGAGGGGDDMQEAEAHGAPVDGRMPHPNDVKKSTPRPYTGALPHQLNDLVESSSPRFAGEEIPFLFERRGGGDDGSTKMFEEVLGRCYGLVGAAEQVPSRANEWKRQKQLEVVDVGGGLQYVNVDLSQPAGIDRAALLGVASSGLADYISASRAQYASHALLSRSRRGRMVAALRHPVDAAVARFYARKAAGDRAVASMTLQEYAASDEVRGRDEVTRYLSGRSDAAGSEGSHPLGRAHVDLAMAVLRRKSLVVLYEEADESVRRAERYLGLEGAAASADCLGDILSEASDWEASLAEKYGAGADVRMPPKDDPVYMQLAEKNKLDMELYEYARDLLFPAQAGLPMREAKPFDERRFPPDRNCVENGHFAANPPEVNWYPVQSQLRVVRGVNDKGNALQAVNRGHQIFGGMWQNLEAGCLGIGEAYEFRATVRATMRGTDDPFECDPTILFNNVAQSCPAVGIRIGERRTEVALTVGPAKEAGEWMELYGVMRATSEMLAYTVSVFVSRAPPDVDLTVDSMSLAPAGDKAMGITDCARPVANGDAEAGDHRFWFIRGAKGGGRIEMVSPGYGGSKYAFRHSGSREQRYRGMLQRLDASCFTEGTTWTITARFRYYSVGRNGQVKFATCRKDNPKAQNSCPVFDMDFISPNGAQVNTGPLQNEAPGDAKAGEWNEIRHTMTVNSDMALRPQVLLYVNSVDPNYNYDLDDISMVLL